MVISYKMTMSVRSCLSYKPLKLDFIAFKMDNISRTKRIADTDVVNYVRVLLHVWSNELYDTTLSAKYYKL